jgi:YHS domain-containing protein
MEESYGLQDYSDHQPVYSIDPVCGMKIDEAKTGWKAGYAGVTYYFCSSDCRTKFEEDPGEFIGQKR